MSSVSSFWKATSFRISSGQNPQNKWPVSTRRVTGLFGKQNGFRSVPKRRIRRGRQQPCQVTLGGNIFRCEAKRLLVLRNCVNNAAFREKRAAQVCVSIGVLRKQLQRFFVMHNGFVEPSFAKECTREVVLRFGLVRQNGYTREVIRDCTIHIAF